MIGKKKGNTETRTPKSQSKDSKKDYPKKLFKAFYLKPISRRMAVTSLGFKDQTYMATQFVSDWIKQGRAQVVGSIRCERSGRIVEAITTNPAFFVSEESNQLKMF